MARLTIEQVKLDRAGSDVDLIVTSGDPNGIIAAPAGSIAFDDTTPAWWQGQGGTVWIQISGGGGGGVIGIPPTTIDHFALWNDTTADSIKNSALLHLSGADYAGLSTVGITADLVLRPAGTGAIQAQIADGTAAGGNTRGVSATDFGRDRTSASQVASGESSTLSGGFAGEASGDFSTVSGGDRGVASGEGSTVGGGSENEAREDYGTVGGGLFNHSDSWSGTIAGGDSNEDGGDFGCTVGGGGLNVVGPTTLYTTIAGGDRNTALGDQAFIGGGSLNEVTLAGISGTISGGDGNLVSAEGAAVFGGRTNVASEDFAGSFGFEARADHYGEVAFASGSFDVLNPGRAQHSSVTLRTETSAAGQTRLTLDGGAPTATNQFTLEAGTSYAFLIRIIAQDVATGDSAWWEFAGAIQRPGAVGTTELAGPVFLRQGGKPSTAAWDAEVEEDTAIGCLAVTVEGEVGTTIRWVASGHMTKAERA